MLYEKSLGNKIRQSPEIPGRLVEPLPVGAE
jgi:hypothetical protein